ncbi:MAG: bifunctional precorrin-2 dehydrogenase/sirohydrochlorin ferrochelatase [Sulfurimonas sp.]|uniref:precorrin-2 dehydrogenase/sirohydrochlorin ferrochelatase family protein n=1 Tax=Sulfurimonas sp. TaxID=2022749 RepID=UPI00260D31AC|nr:bifunctional precorrin-2 dehydrogenase/sirohydrochlorin ferrochelatase [Sulfurimonas sp.]MDD3475585.1 bifunctional precorrin-2 dehydrogenase/sirohydrochlorin ferrochelatase [Sulfurimonas sp.]
MSYFPAFLNLEDKRVLLVGGGEIAHTKLVHLLDFTSEISIIAQELSEKTKALAKERNLSVMQRAYSRGDITNFDIVIVAVDDISLQVKIFEESKQYNCLCSCVDSSKQSDFIFGSYIKKDDLTIAVSTSGASPALAKEIKKYLLNLIPDDIGAFLQEMKSLRETLPKGKDRMKMFKKRAEDYIKRWSN